MTWTWTWRRCNEIISLDLHFRLRLVPAIIRLWLWSDNFGTGRFVLITFMSFSVCSDNSQGLQAPILSTAWCNLNHDVKIICWLADCALRHLSCLNVLRQTGAASRERELRFFNWKLSANCDLSRGMELPCFWDCGLSTWAQAGEWPGPDWPHTPDRLTPSQCGPGSCRARGSHPTASTPRRECGARGTSRTTSHSRLTAGHHRSATITHSSLDGNWSESQFRSNSDNFHWICWDQQVNWSLVRGRRCHSDTTPLSPATSWWSPATCQPAMLAGGRLRGLFWLDLSHDWAAAAAKAAKAARAALWSPHSSELSSHLSLPLTTPHYTSLHLSTPLYTSPSWAGEGMEWNLNNLSVSHSVWKSMSQYGRGTSSSEKC